MKAYLRRGLLLAAITFAAGGLAWLLLPKPPLLDGVSFSREIFDRQHRLLRVTLANDDKYRLYTPLAQISPAVVDATLVQEDRYFWLHAGVNPVSTLRCAWNLAWHGHSRAGASTVSMQLARLRFHLRTRTLAGKFIQMFRAIQIERHYTKAQILEAYLNLAPYGRNIEGIAAASRYYFDKTPAGLTLPEAALLSVIPQSPSRRAPYRDRDNGALASARNRLYERLALGRPGVDPLGESFRARAGQWPFFAPHFTNAVLSQTPAASGETQTTLDLDLQRLTERQIAHYLNEKAQVGLKNAAVMLTDTRTGDILAQAGSANYFDASIDGQVDGTRSRRSPGSALKPFVYALALDQGLIHPLTLLADAPRRFCEYTPENFDRDFVGPISATNALARSRNIPAVALASRLAKPTLYEFLVHAGVCLQRDESFYGLALPLGGGEVTMEELVTLYAALANDGKPLPLRRVASSQVPAPSPRVLSPEAAFLTLEMLGKIPPPGIGIVDPAFPVFWKTGTSWGCHDAWAVAVFDHYVLAVWIGNFDGRPNPAFVGATGAGPLLFQIIDAMRAAGAAKPHRHEPPPGANLRRVELCAVSGQLPTAACHCRTSGWFIPGVSPIGACEIHREVLIDKATGLRVATDDGTRELRREVYEFWPSDMLELFRRAGIPRRIPPPLLPTADGAVPSAAGGLRITSPRGDVTYQKRPGETSLFLQAQAAADLGRVYWFAGKCFLGTSNDPAGLAWQPQPGAYLITALDEQGRTGSCRVRVEAAP